MVTVDVAHVTSLFVLLSVPNIVFKTLLLFEFPRHITPMQHTDTATINEYS